MKSATFRGKRYKVYNQRIAGYVLDESCPDEREIYLDPGIRGHEALDRDVHEALHAEFHAMSETEVGTAASDIGRFLWRLGYRKRKQ